MKRHVTVSWFQYSYTLWVGCSCLHNRYNRYVRVVLDGYFMFKAYSIGFFHVSSLRVVKNVSRLLNMSFYECLPYLVVLRDLFLALNSRNTPGEALGTTWVARIKLGLAKCKARALYAILSLGIFLVSDLLRKLCAII